MRTKKRKVTKSYTKKEIVQNRTQKRITGSCEKWNKKRVSLHDMRGWGNSEKLRENANKKRIMQHDNAQEQETLIFRAKLN